jgi:hypothetical protein
MPFYQIRMKVLTPIPCFVALLVFCALPASALPDFKDAFTSTTLNNKWQPFSDNGGKLVLKNGKLNLVTPTATADGASGAVILKSPNAGVNESWETRIVVTNNTTSGEAWTGFLIGNANSLFENNVSIELAQYEGQNRVTSFSAAGGNEKRTKEILTAAKKVYLRVNYNADTRILKLFYRVKPDAKWITLHSYSPFNSTAVRYRGNWGLNADTGKFSLILFGGSVNKVNAGAVTIDNFLIRNTP